MSSGRERAASWGAETQGIVAQERYTAPDGRDVDLAAAIAHARAGTVSYPPEAELPVPAHGAQATRYAVTEETTLAAARRLVAGGARVVALNFASARHPGGGWLSGARAQEESLARASALVACIADDPMYARHEAVRDAMYTNSAIYSPDVPVFRDDEGQLLATPWLLSFITAPAVNAGIVLERDRGRRADIAAAMRERVARVLAIAAVHGHDTLVLGAWGCGVFRNDPHDIAAIFAAALRGAYAGVFAQVVFAVYDTTLTRQVVSAFRREFAAEIGAPA